MNITGKIISTTYSQGRKQEKEEVLHLTMDDGTENQAVNLYPQALFQTFEGFGGAFTDAAGFVFSQMTKEQQDTLIQAYYGEGSLGYVLGRTHLDSCDFSVEPYQAIVQDVSGKVTGIDISRGMRYVLPMLHAAQKALGRSIPMMAAPWSPPDFMKTNGQRNGGGSLKKECYTPYAEYLSTLIATLRKEDMQIVQLTTQNEPNAVQTWDSCIFTPHEEKVFIRDHLYPALHRHGLGNVGLFIWDHNKERVFERACEVIDADTDGMVAGIAFHWYSGDHFEALQLTRDRFPNKKMVQSEACIEYSHFSPDQFLQNAHKYAHDIIGDLNNGMTAFYDWNLLLDAQGGPNHVGNYCDAPFMYHMDTGVLEERASYAYIGHFSRYIAPGARRIGFSRYTDAVEMTAFENPDGSLVAVLLNKGTEALPVALRVQGQITQVCLAGESISTVTLFPPQG